MCGNMSGGFSMKRCFVVLAIGFSLAVMAAQTGYCSVAGVALATKPWTDVQPVNASLSLPPTPAGLSLSGDGSFLLAKDVDLRDIDWGKVTDGENGNGESKDSVNGDKNGDDDDEAEESGDEEKGEKEEAEDEGGGGWDRLWDAPRLG
jgi:hypothetical protein